MKILIDQNLPVPVAALLRELGHDAVHTRELGLQRAVDEELLKLASNQGRLIVTLDIDFSTLLAKGNLNKPSVILLRERGLFPKDVCARVSHLCEIHQAKLEGGCLIILGATSVRVRDLPLWQRHI
jgi:predicted nuclease of predicted toxin-antitoxin system